MRFSLRTLLLMFTAIAAAYGGAWVYLRNKYESSIDVEAISKDLTSDLKKVQKWATWLNKSSNLNDWPYLIQNLNNQLAEGHVPYTSARRSTIFFYDNWGRPFHAISLDSQGNPQPDQLSSSKIGMYSLGQDGKSESFGNDPDDLNSWHPSTEFYLQQAKRQASDRARVEALGIASVPLALVLGFVFLFRDPHLACKEESQTV